MNAPLPPTPLSPYAARRRRQTINQLIFLAVFLAAMYLILNAFGVFRGARPGTHNITFRVDGNASTALITYTRADGKSSPKFDASLAWSETINFPRGQLVILTAGNTTATGKIRCRLFLDGAEWKRDEAPDKVSCAGMVPP